MDKRKNSKKIIRIIGKIFSFLTIIFIVIKIYKLGFDVSFIDDFPLFIGFSIIALLLKMLSVFLTSLAWGQWVSFFSKQTISSINLFVVYGRAAIGKYLPGNVMNYVGRNLFASDYGFSQKKVVLGSVAETVEIAIAAVLLSFILLPRNFRSGIATVVFEKKSILLVVAIILSLTIIVLLGIVLKKREAILSSFKQYAFADLCSIGLITMLEYLLSLVMLGVGMLFLAWYYLDGGMNWETIRIVISSYATAWVCGFIIPGASGGIGIRETILCFLLNSLMNESALMFIIIAHRLVTIIGDFIIYAISIFLYKYAKTRTSN